ncbi:hypothetical protein BC628DRAFT_1340303 [Trametes gibbosa]|nr:hypothetical protein BC628DRAFT_1340303 [Trametes gibbosa]
MSLRAEVSESTIDNEGAVRGKAPSSGFVGSDVRPVFTRISGTKNELLAITYPMAPLSRLPCHALLENTILPRFHAALQEIRWHQLQLEARGKGAVPGPAMALRSWEPDLLDCPADTVIGRTIFCNIACLRSMIDDGSKCFRVRPEDEPGPLLLPPTEYTARTQIAELPHPQGWIGHGYHDWQLGAIPAKNTHGT